MERAFNMKRFVNWAAGSQHLVEVLAISVWSVLSLGTSDSAFAQKGCAGCRPVSERTGELGCWILASEPVGQLSAHSVFWHLDKFSTVALAEQAKEGTGTVLPALGKVWLLTIAQAGWRPKGGERVAEIGPPPVTTIQNTVHSTWKRSSIREWRRPRIG